MNEENKAVPEIDVNNVLQQIEEFKTQLQEKEKAIEALARKNAEILDEKKKQQSKIDEVAEQKAKEMAYKNGDFKQLLETEQRSRKELEQKLSLMQKANRNEKLQINALKVAGELADGDNIELLSEFVVRELDKVADENGMLSVETLETIKAQYLQNAKYKSLLRSSKATGGGAPGNASKTGAITKEISRADFDKLDLSSRAKFFANGGKLTD